MKKIILISAICAICTQAHSQWKITGNAGTNATTNFIGTTDNVAFKIRTNNAVRITVSGSGKVGVGTTAPVFKLDVKGGSINTDSLFRISGVQVLNRNASNQVQIGDATAKVGIGTGAPTYLLDLQGNTACTSFFNVNSKVNYVGNSDVRAFYGHSHPAGGYGYGIQAYGGYYGGNFSCNDGAYGFGIGVYGNATGTTGSQYGVYGIASGGTSNYAVYANGITYSTGGYSSSDAKLKKDIRVIENALAKINQLQPRTYTFKTDEYNYMGCQANNSMVSLLRNWNRYFLKW